MLCMTPSGCPERRRLSLLVAEKISNLYGIKELKASEMDVKGLSYEARAEQRISENPLADQHQGARMRRVRVLAPLAAVLV